MNNVTNAKKNRRPEVSFKEKDAGERWVRLTRETQDTSWTKWRQTWGLVAHTPRRASHLEDGRGSQTAGDRTPNWRTSAQPASKRPSRTNTKVVKLTVEKWFVDKGFGFGKVQTGEVVFIHASVVHGAEVLAVDADARTQVVSDHARAE